MRTSPRLAGTRPATIESNVLLPQPLGPTMERNSPAPTSRLTSSTASTGWPSRAAYDLDSALTWMKTGDAVDRGAVVIGEAPWRLTGGRRPACPSWPGRSARDGPASG